MVIKSAKQTQIGGNVNVGTAANNTPDITSPLFANAAVNGNTLVMTYIEATTLEAVHKAPSRPLP